MGVNTPLISKAYRGFVIQKLIIPQKKEAIDQLDYGLDFSKLKPWNQCRFMRMMPRK